MSRYGRIVHIVYCATAGNRQFVVVDGLNGKPYDAVLATGFVFDCADSFHHLAKHGKDIYLVEETLR